MLLKDYYIIICCFQVREAEVYKTSALLVNPFLYLRLIDHSYVAPTQENRIVHHCINVSLKMVRPRSISYNHLLLSKYDMFTETCDAIYNNHD